MKKRKLTGILACDGDYAVFFGRKDEFPTAEGFMDKVFDEYGYYSERFPVPYAEVRDVVVRACVCWEKQGFDYHLEYGTLGKGGTFKAWEWAAL